VRGGPSDQVHLRCIPCDLVRVNKFTVFARPARIDGVFRGLPGRKQDRARVCGGQRYEVKYEAKNASRSSATVRQAVRKTGNRRKREAARCLNGGVLSIVNTS
jgi:uncharacterized protein DUF3606